VAKLGGFRGRKSDGDPGTEVMWRGLQRLDDITQTWQLLQHAVELRTQQLQRRVDEMAEALRVAMTRGP
jgi:hypothetical protein